MTRRTTLQRVFGFGTGLLVMLMVSATSWANDHGDEDELEFEEWEIFFELNDTDHDLGIHALLDGDAWKKIRIEDPDENTLLGLKLLNGLKKQGLTELFFESAEPVFDELDPEEFFERFPPGEYEVEGRTVEGEEIEGETELTHTIPAPPGNLTINGIPARPLDGSDCDEENPAELSNPVVVAWDAVTNTHAELGEPGEVEVLRYQIVAEWENEDEVTFVSSVDIVPDGDTEHYSITVSPEFFVDETEFKFEALVRETSYNQAAVESCMFEFVANGAD